MWPFGHAAIRRNAAKAPACGAPAEGVRLDPCNGVTKPSFWACGVTPQSVIAAAKVPFAITHSPGLMLVTDLLNKDLAVL